MGIAMNDVIKSLEEWQSGDKGRFVTISKDTDYGANCWEITLGNVNKRPEKDWFISYEQKLQEKSVAEVYGSETSFFAIDRKIPPNVVIVIDPEDESTDFYWPGLEKTILKTLEKAKELGL